MTPAALQLLISQAISDGINFKRLYLISGLNWQDFGKYHQDMLFSSEQSVNLEKEIRAWRSELKQTNQQELF